MGWEVTRHKTMEDGAVGVVGFLVADVGAGWVEIEGVWVLQREAEQPH